MQTTTRCTNVIIDNCFRTIAPCRENSIPGDGYDENEDCYQAEDQSFYDFVDDMEHKYGGSRKVYSGGELIFGDEDEDEIGDQNAIFADLNTPIDEIHVPKYFFDALSMLQTENPDIFQYLMQSLDESCRTNLHLLAEQLNQA